MKEVEAEQLVYYGQYCWTKQTRCLLQVWAGEPWTQGQGSLPPGKRKTSWVVRSMQGSWERQQRQLTDSGSRPPSKLQGSLASKREQTLH